MRTSFSQENNGTITRYSFGNCHGILMLGDSESMDPPLGDALITDPPYGIAFSHGDGGGCLAQSTRFANQPIIGDDKPFDPSRWMHYAVVVLWGGNHFSSKLPDRACWLVWDKRDGVCSNDQADCELAWTNLKSPARLKRHLWNGMLKDSERSEQRVHPMQKPVVLMSWTFEQCRLPIGATVVDPYMGSGTIGIACIRTSRNYVGIEKDDGFYRIACERVKKELDGMLF